MNIVDEPLISTATGSAGVGAGSSASVFDCFTNGGLFSNARGNCVGRCGEKRPYGMKSVWKYYLPFGARQVW